MSDTLVLNRNFAAIHIASWQKAVSLLYQGHAQAVDSDLCTHDFNDWVELSQKMKENQKGFVNSATLRIAVPEVIRLTRYDRLPRQEVKFSRRNIYEHYHNKCCYCGHRYSTKELNLDHVTPRSRGGHTDWDNIVLSCVPCNSRKNDKTPEEAGMRLLVKPSKPKWRGVNSIVVQSPVPIPVSWQHLIDHNYWQSELVD